MWAGGPLLLFHYEIGSFSSQYLPNNGEQGPSLIATSMLSQKWAILLAPGTFRVPFFDCPAHLYSSAGGGRQGLPRKKSIHLITAIIIANSLITFVAFYLYLLCCWNNKNVTLCQLNSSLTRESGKAWRVCKKNR